MARNVIASIEQGPERFGGSQRQLRVAGKELEETFLSRHQGPKPSQHERLAFSRLDQTGPAIRPDAIRAIEATGRRWPDWITSSAPASRFGGKTGSIGGLETDDQLELG
ncbi:MAG TPA: hypothetical protein VGL31_09440 [Xanthobacteraceae bacterium]